MFNIFPPKKTVDEIIEDADLPNKIWEWTPTQTPSYLQAQQEIIDELMKEINNLRPLKIENVKLMERLQKKGYSFNEVELQIMQNDYKKCAEQRDEYKHQFNAANKENEELRIKLRNYQDKYAESFSYHDMKKLQNKIDELTLMYKERESKLKTYNTSLLGQIAGLKEENKNLNLKTEKYYACNHCGYKVAHDTNYYGGCGFCKDGLMIEKEEVVQKHPMYPIHWGNLDPDIYEKAKNMSIEEAIKDVVKAEVENEDPFHGIPKSFPNEFQEETTAENLEEKFDKGEDVTDYFKKNIEKSWEEAASDLALRVVKLEKKIEELTIINICQK
jgi:hypothetical protein